MKCQICSGEFEQKVKFSGDTCSPGCARVFWRAWAEGLIMWKEESD